MIAGSSATQPALGAGHPILWLLAPRHRPVMTGGDATGWLVGLRVLTCKKRRVVNEDSAWTACREISAEACQPTCRRVVTGQTRPAPRCQSL